MTNLDKLLKEFKEARSAAPDGKWEVATSIDKRRGTLFIEERIAIANYGPEGMQDRNKLKSAFDFSALAANNSAKLINIIEVMKSALDEVKANGHSDLCNAMKSRRPNYRCTFEEADEALQQAEKIAGEHA